MRLLALFILLTEPSYDVQVTKGNENGTVYTVHSCAECEAKFWSAEA